MTSRNSNNFKGQRMNFNDENLAFEAKGTKPTREASSIKEIFVLMIIHVCKKILFIDTNLKIALYLGALFLLSLFADVLTFPKSYFSRSDNVFNQYFVKLGWFWTLLLTTPFVGITSYTTCCGNRSMALTRHLSRLAIATCAWYFWTSAFNVIETKYGKCNSKMFNDKISCLKNGNFWNGFDISGHCFILIYSSLVMIEEARAIIGWETIKDHIRDELYSRSIDEKGPRSNPLKNISNKELSSLKEAYEKFTPYVRLLLLGITCLHILWDVMLMSTIIYYHIMVEKFVSGIIAVMAWYITYKVWFKTKYLLPSLPGEGVFKYFKEKPTPITAVHKKRLSSSNSKHFMGMPIYKEKETTDSVSDDKR